MMQVLKATFAREIPLGATCAFSCCCLCYYSTTSSTFQLMQSDAFAVALLTSKPLLACSGGGRRRFSRKATVQDLKANLILMFILKEEPCLSLDFDLNQLEKTSLNCVTQVMIIVPFYIQYKTRQHSSSSRKKERNSGGTSSENELSTQTDDVGNEGQDS